RDGGSWDCAGPIQLQCRHQRLQQERPARRGARAVPGDAAPRAAAGRLLVRGAHEG
ncbi:unnamed protein product, partial [Heterosigma akashiwo]